MKKIVSVIAFTQLARVYIERQLGEYISDVAEIKGYSLEEGLDGFKPGDLLVVSSDTMYEKLEDSAVIEKALDVVVAKRTINYDCIDRIVLIPSGTDVLFVNDSEKTTLESIDTLKRLGIDHINYIPHYPGKSEIPRGIQVCITAGEMDKVPSGMKTVYDIGIRTIDFQSVAEILSRLDYLDEMAGGFSDKYLMKLINVAKRLARSTCEIGRLYEDLNVVIDGFNEGILVYDCKGIISVFNENLKKMLKIPQRNSPVQKRIADVIRNKRLLEFLTDSDSDRSEILNVDGFEIVAKKVFLEKNGLHVAVVKGARQSVEENEKIKRELVSRGFYAKHTFDDIIGSSRLIGRTKDVCERLARSNLTILIEGESGTGKELFASAIHNASDRKKGPFLAVNFSALPDELIESELFGYEEGAFTGAVKGGKAGLFEQADGGTIFLDEIGDVSLKVQARLLRVLQEKEVMRIGAMQIKSVDVRVIAATNKDLSQMVNERRFRQDLYYRLKIGHIRIPPLRSRKDDIEGLARHFANIQTPDGVEICDDVIERLVGQEWRGNVRELQNTISYMMAVRRNRLLTVDDMPQNHMDEALRCEQDSLEEYRIRSVCGHMAIGMEEIQVLREIKNLRLKGESAGRDSISRSLLKAGIGLTSHQIRLRLDRLKQAELVAKGRGRFGTALTQKGEELLEYIEAQG